MAGTKVESLLLTAGQNEGIETAVLPAPQLRNVTNMRLRKGSRWGKRYGHTALATGNLGAATGRFRAVGGAIESGFVVVDDIAYNYSRAAADFVAQSAKVSSALFSGTQQTSGAISGWTPRTSFTPVPAIGRQLQTTTPCAQCLALGVLWTAVRFDAPLGGTDGVIRVVATDLNDQTLLAVFDFSAAIGGFGGLTTPKLVLCGATLVLAYLYTSAAGVTNVMGRTLTSLAGGFSAEVAMTATGDATAFDIASYSNTQFLMARTRAAGAAVYLYAPGALGAPATTQLIAAANPATSISVVGSPSAAIYVGYGTAATGTAKVTVYPAGLGAATGTVFVSATSASRPLLCLLGSGSVRCVAAATTAAATTAPSFTVVDVSSAAAVGTSITQPAAYPISMPFSTADGSIYIWAIVGQSDRATTLLKLITPNASYGIVSLPIELSVQDLLATANTFDLQGLPLPVLVTDADYSALIPTAVGDQSGGIDTGHIFRAIQSTHFTGSAAYRSARVSYADSVSFLALGALTRIDDYGPAESGFVHKPALGTLTPAAGGAMTPSSDYYYTAIYRVQNSAGRYEVSAPCTPVKATLGPGDSRVTVTYLPLCLTGRNGKSVATVEIYRTLANGQTFYLDQVITPANTSGAFLVVSDVRSDASIATQKALYTQVGQALPNAFPPPARFSCVGGQRVFLGGLVRPDVVQGSKLIFGDQSPSFADSDAFKLVLPAPCTGIAWMDVLVMFTAEGIYIASGDGPDDSGLGDFGTLTRMPYELGCIEPRSVIVVDDGCFFQTARGLYLLPRGFGTPVPAGDNVQDTLAAYPVITGSVTLTKPTEQSVLWTCSDSGGVAGQRIAYDLAHKVWSVDDIAGGNALCGAGQWLSNEVAIFRSSLAIASPIQSTSSAFSDAASAAITASFSTGHLRPFGPLSEGVMSKIQLLSELRSACTLSVAKFTEWAGSTTTRAFALAVGDYQIGQVTVTEVDLGNSELRDAMRLSLSFSETSTGEGLAFIALAMEHEQGEGLKRVFDLARVT